MTGSALLGADAGISDCQRDGPRPAGQGQPASYSSTSEPNSPPPRRWLAGQAHARQGGRKSRQAKESAVDSYRQLWAGVGSGGMDMFGGPAPDACAAGIGAFTEW